MLLCDLFSDYSYCESVIFLFDHGQYCHWSTITLARWPKLSKYSLTWYFAQDFEMNIELKYWWVIQDTYVSSYGLWLIKETYNWTCALPTVSALKMFTCQQRALLKKKEWKFAFFNKYFYWKVTKLTFISLTKQLQSQRQLSSAWRASLAFRSILWTILDCVARKPTFLSFLFSAVTSLLSNWLLSSSLYNVCYAYVNPLPWRHSKSRSRHVNIL